MTRPLAFLAALLSVFAGCDHAHGPDCAHAHNHAHASAEKHDHAHGPDCTHAHDHHPAPTETHDHAHACTTKSHPDVKTITVPLAVQRVMGLETVRPETRRVTATFTHPGRFELAPQASTRVATPVAGRLALCVRPLDNVTNGTPLFTVSSPDLVARARELAVLEKRLAVYRNIKKPNAALENEWAVKRAERAALLAGADETNGVVTVRAQTDGRVDAYDAQNGAWLETGAPALRLVRPRALRFKAFVAAADASRLRDGMRATVGQTTGTVRLGVGDDTGLTPVYVVFAGDVPARAGERADMTCVTDGRDTPVLAVPTTCLVQIGLQPTLFARDRHTPERFLAVPVTPGVQGGGWTAIDGLPAHAGEIVRGGAYELKLALQADGTKPSGHFHADGVFHEGEH